MKRLLQDYTNFTRTERMGIMVLCTAIVLLLIFKATMPMWVKPEKDEAKEKELIAAWNNIKKQQITTKPDAEIFVAENNKKQQITTIAGDTDQANLQSQQNRSSLFAFDPNTIDSVGLRKLGLREKTTSIFLNWRRKGKRFYQKEELRKLYTLSADEYKRLEPYITINNTLNSRHYNYESDYGPLPATIELNKADSITLVRLKGIGPKLAHRILERRRTLGEFTRYEQLLDLYRFPDSTFRMLKERLVIN